MKKHVAGGLQRVFLLFHGLTLPRVLFDGSGNLLLGEATSRMTQVPTFAIGHRVGGGEVEFEAHRHEADEENQGGDNPETS
jgi:hypothetical protein